MLHTFTGEVSRVTDLTHDVRMLQIVLADPPTIRFQAGQFVTFKVPRPGLAPVTRAYSIASSPQCSGAIELLFNLVPGGPGSTYLFSLKPGDRVSFRGPAGRFVLDPDQERRILFVATGTGIAPIRSMLHACLPRSRPVTLVWGLRYERDLYYGDELAALAQRYQEFSYLVTLSRPSPSWRGPAGRVQQHLGPHLDRVDDLTAYVCGNSAMIESVTALIQSRGPCPVHAEQYYRDLASVELDT